MTKTKKLPKEKKQKKRKESKHIIMYIKKKINETQSKKSRKITKDR